MKSLTESVEFISASFDKYEGDRKKKDEMMNSLEENLLGLTEKGTIFKKKLYSHTVLKKNQNEDANEVPYLPKKVGLNFVTLRKFRHLGPTKVWAFSNILYRSKIVI